MRAVRFCLLGYGTAAIAGGCISGYSGHLAGLLTAWLGGSILTLVLAYAWFRATKAGAFRTTNADKLPVRLTDEANPGWLHT